MYDPDVLNKMSGNDGPNLSFNQKSFIFNRSERSGIGMAPNASKKSNLRNSGANQLNTSTQGKKPSLVPNTILPTNENSVYQQTRESNVSNFTRNSMAFGKSNLNQDSISKGNNDTSINRSSAINNSNQKGRLASNSPQKAGEKKVQIANSASLNKQAPKRSSMPVTQQRSAVNKKRNDGVEVIPFNDEFTGKTDFKKKNVGNKGQEEDFVTGLINDGYVE